MLVLPPLKINALIKAKNEGKVDYVYMCIHVYGLQQNYFIIEKKVVLLYGP